MIYIIPRRLAAFALAIALLLTLCACEQGGGDAPTDTNASATTSTLTMSEEATSNIVTRGSSATTSAAKTSSATLPSDMVTPTNATAMNAYKSVLQGQAKYKAMLQAQDVFNNTDVYLNISQILLAITTPTYNNPPAKVTGFSVIDMDNDGVPEIVLSLAVGSNQDFGYLVLKYQNNIVCGYLFSLKQFAGLKTDGTFGFSSGAGDYGYGSISFTTTEYPVDKIAYCQSGTDSDGNITESYFVNHKSATEDEFTATFNQQNGKPGATFYDFTSANIKAIFSY